MTHSYNWYWLVIPTSGYSYKWFRGCLIANSESRTLSCTWFTTFDKTDKMMNHIPVLKQVVNLQVVKTNSFSGKIILIKTNLSVLKSKWENGLWKGEFRLFMPSEWRIEAIWYRLSCFCTVCFEFSSSGSRA